MCSCGLWTIYRLSWQAFRVFPMSIPSDCPVSAYYVTTVSFLIPSSLLFTEHIVRRFIARTSDSDVKQTQ
jgi:hypothetical protein